MRNETTDSNIEVEEDLGNQEENYGENDDINFDDLDNVDEDTETHSEVDEDEDENIEKEDEELDDFDELFKEDEEFSVEKLDLDKIEGYNDSEVDKKAIAKLGEEVFKLGVKGKAVKPVVELIGNILNKFDENSNGKITKETYSKMSVADRTSYKLLTSNAKQVLDKTELETFSKLFNSEEKIRLASKLFGVKPSRTGSTEYDNGGRKPSAETMSYNEFDSRIQNITMKYMREPEKERKALANLYKEAKSSSNPDVREYLKNNPL